jgi:hypothetical protein
LIIPSNNSTFRFVIGTQKRGARVSNPSSQHEHKAGRWKFDQLLKIIKEYNLQTGLIQLILAILVTIFFPIIQTWQESNVQRKFNLLTKKEEMISKFCHTISFTLTIMDHLRSCHMLMQCDKKSPYNKSCDNLISEGTMALSTSQETYESVCEISSVYFSKKVGGKLDIISKKIDRLFELDLPQCDGNDDEYMSMLADIRKNDYPAIVEMMREEVIVSRVNFQ